MSDHETGPPALRGRRCESGVLVSVANRARPRGRFSHRSRVLVRTVTTCSVAALAVVFGALLLSRCCEQDGDAKAFVTIMAKTVFPLLGLFRSEFVMNKPQHAGHLFADVVLGRIRPPAGRHYVSLVKGKPTFPEPSPLACQEIEQDRLWRDSATMVGLSPSPEPTHG